MEIESNGEASLNHESPSVNEIDSNVTDETFWIFGDANWEILSPTIDGELKSRLGPITKVRVPNFGEWNQKIYDAKKFDSKSDLVVFAQRIEDFQRNPMGVLPVNELSSIKQGIFDYLSNVRMFASNYEGKVLLFDFCQLFISTSLQHDPYRELTQIVNEEIKSLVAEVSNLHVVRYSDAVSRIGTNAANPGSFWFLGRSPLSSDGARELAVEIARTIVYARSNSIRLVITDLDDTFWGGIIGEVGVEGINIGGDYPGNVYAHYQLFLRELKENGVALAIASKNTEKIVIEALNSHPEMQLRENDFASIQVNWNSKADSITQISKELNISFENIIFVDDSPHEREEVRSRLSGINVPDLSDDAVIRVEQLSSEIRLSIGTLTEEDANRANRYLERKQRMSEQSKFESREAYLNSLQTRVTISKMNSYSENRILQLINKTNQFNFTTKRYNKKDLEQIISNGGNVLSISVEDKFSEVEIVGVLVLVTSEDVMVVDSFLLSCRVLGRGIEQAVLGWVINLARTIGHSRLVGMWIQSDRNTPTIGLLEQMGFVQSSAEEFSFEVKKDLGLYSYMNGIEVVSDV
jgi:FkbH-like protein